MNKLLGILMLLLVLVGCAQVQQPEEPMESKPAQEMSEAQQAAESNEFYERIPIIDAYYNGEKIWFIHTDVSDSGMADRLTMMVGYRTLHVPKNAEAIDASKLAKLYVFTNGIDQSGAEPWGGGPFNYQIDIFDSVPGDEGYTSVRNPQMVTWNAGAKARILTSVDEVLVAEEAGELMVMRSPVVVNVPVVRWSGSYLGGSSAME